MTIQRRFGMLLGLVAVSATLGFAAVLWTVTIYQTEAIRPFAMATTTMANINTLSRELGLADSAIDADPDLRAEASGRLRQLADTLVADEAATGVGVSGLRTLRTLTLAAADAIAGLDPDDPASIHAARLAVAHTASVALRINAQLLDTLAQSAVHGRSLKARLNTVLLVTLAIVLLVTLLGVLLVRRWILTPIDRLRVAAERIAEDDYTHRVSGVGGRDEFARLGATVNRMATQIAESRRREVERERLAAAGAMVRRLAHNIRNPLAGIRSLAELTRQEAPAGSEARDLQDRIITTIDHFERWLADLVRAASNPRLAPAPHRVRDWVRETIEPHRAHAEARGVTIEVDADLAPPSAVFDGQSLEHAVVAVLFNAIEASSQGQTVRVRAEANGTRWRLSIRDQGPGVSPDDEKRVFRPDFTTKPGGHGLGLATAAHTAGAHGGRLTLARPDRESDPSGQAPPGAEFIFELPLTPPTMEPRGAGDESRGETRGNGGQNPAHRG